MFSSLLDKYLTVNTAIQAKATIKTYRLAISQFSDFLGHSPEMSDLSDDTLALWQRHMLASGLSVPSVNQRVRCLRAFWTWCAKRDRSLPFPTIRDLREPETERSTWTEDEMAEIWRAARCYRGMDSSVGRWRQWIAYLETARCTGERTSALRAVQWNWVDLEKGVLRIPASARKGRQKRRSYKLSAEAIQAIADIRLTSATESLVWPYVGNCGERTYFARWQRLLRSTSLAGSAKEGIQKMRRTVLTRAAIAGKDPVAMARHSSASVTYKYYVDQDEVICGSGN